MLHLKGPLLLAANHPNSFLDGIILTTLFKENIYSLARGDAFRNKNHKWLLHKMNLLPVYRTSEGVENLENNYTTFASCQDVFSKDGIVLIFSEGRCINEWHFRPLKKGTARLATSTWEKGDDLTVLPVALNYSPFRVFGKNVIINFGEPIDKEPVLEHTTDGKLLLAFNKQLHQQLKNLVFEIKKTDKSRQKELLYIEQSLSKKILLAVPAVIGFVVHAPLYFLAKAGTKKYFDNDHFDSALVSLLLLSYPFYLLLLFVLIAGIGPWYFAAAVLIAGPFTAWAAVQLKPQMQ